VSTSGLQTDEKSDIFMRPAAIRKSMRFAIKLLAPYVFLVLIVPSNSLGFGKIIDVQDTARGEVVRDMVFDAVGKYLYISTSFGLVERYNLSTGSLETPYDLGGSLNGLDISPDDSFLLVAQASFGPTEGTLEKVDLSTGAITGINYTLDTVLGEAGVWDVAIASNGLAFMTTQYPGSGWTPLRQLDLSTDEFMIRSDAPGSGPFGYVDGGSTDGTKIYRGADRTRLCFLEGGASDGPFFTYDAATDTFGPNVRTNYFLDNAHAGVNRSGDLIGLIYGPNFLTLETASSLGLLHSFNGLDLGVAFNAVQDIVYGANSSTDEIVGYDTKTFAEKFRAQVGEDVSQFPVANFPGTILAASQDGRYVALATDADIRLVPTVSTGSAKLANISTREDIETGDNVLIGGFIIGGTDAKQVAIRAIGPSLPLTNFLSDPVLELHGGADNSIIAQNDDWESAANSDQIPKELQPGDPRESVILITLEPGSYTAIVRGVGATTGIGLVEVYDLESDADSQLANISARGFVQTEDKVMISGFIGQGGDGISQLLVRALGPSLTTLGVSNALADPLLELHDSDGNLIAENDNWKDTQRDAIENSGLTPSNDLESAIITTVPAGS
jgi:hypothetical protein